MRSHPLPQPHAPSRRSVLRAAAWSVPAVTVAAAAPAYATSTALTPAWTVSAVGWEGTQLGARVRLSTAASRYFDLTFLVPAGATVSGAQVQVVFSPAGNGGDTDDTNLGFPKRFDDGHGGEWTLNKSDRSTVYQHRRYTWTHVGDLAGGATGRVYRLEISFSSVRNADVGDDSFVHVTSQSAAGPAVSYRQLPDNNDVGKGFVLVKA